MKLDRISGGTKYLPLKTAFVLDRMNWYNTTEVTLPAITIANSFMYDFSSEVAKIEGFANNSLGSLMTTAQIMADIFKTTNITPAEAERTDRDGNKFLTSKLIKERASEIGISGEVTDRIINDLIRGFGRSISGTGLAAGVVKSILESQSVQKQIESFRSGTDPNPAKWDEIVKVIKYAQELYGKFCCLEDPAVIQKFIQTDIESSPLVQRIGLLDSILNRTVGPAMPTKLKNAMKGILPFFDMKFLYKTKWQLNVYSEAITEVDWPIGQQSFEGDKSVMGYDDIGYKDLMSQYFKCVRTIMGMDTEYSSTINLFTLLKETIKAGGEWPLILPKELNATHESEVTELFERMFTERLIYMLLRGQYGSYVNRVLSIKDTLKYGRNEHYDVYQRRNINYLSLVMEAFCQTAADCRNYANSPRVTYFDLHPEYLRQAKKYCDEVIDRQKPQLLPYEHPRSINNPDQILKLIGTDIVEMDPNYLWSDKAQSQLTKFLDPVTYSSVSWVRTPILQGVINDAPVANVPLHLLTPDFSATRKPTYFIYQPLPEFVASYPSWAYALKFWSFDDMLDSGLYKYFSNQVELLRYTDADELAREFDIPLALAEDIMKVGKSIFRYNGPDKTLLWWNPELLPVFEAGEVPQSIHIRQFISLWPFFNEGHSGDKVYRLEKSPSGAPNTPSFHTVQYETLAHRMKSASDAIHNPAGGAAEPKDVTATATPLAKDKLNGEEEVNDGKDEPKKPDEMPTSEAPAKGKSKGKTKKNNTK